MDGQYETVRKWRYAKAKFEVGVKPVELDVLFSATVPFAHDVADAKAHHRGIQALFNADAVPVGEKIDLKYLEKYDAFKEYFVYDKGFHQTILESLEDPYFSGLQHSAMGFYDHPELQHDSAVIREEVYRCHKKIYDNIKSGDSHGAYQALIEHSDLMIKDLLETIK